ncbi:hypothetical protein GCM10018781_34370 [Kitasatospora indigofera]|uniref:Uncharacterized protein n=1 Tax=Kitasatospora indigofera TaxID=67307 RepID=A0A919KUD1_9ACTN|nr:hypothetical protein GCM10018781_34370 [Kitasatospora indigofera]
MTVPTGPEVATVGQPPATILGDAVRMVAMALPLTVVALFLGLIWLIGIVVPPAHANSQATGRQAVALVRAMLPRGAGAIR